MPQVTNIKILIDALWISDFIIAPSLRAFALFSIESRKWHFEPADLLYVSRTFKTRRFFVHTFKWLVLMKTWEISNEDIQKMSYPIFHCCCSNDGRAHRKSPHCCLQTPTNAEPQQRMSRSNPMHK